MVTQGQSGTCRNCVTCVSQIGNTKANPELEKKLEICDTHNFLKVWANCEIQLRDQPLEKPDFCDTLV